MSNLANLKSEKFTADFLYVKVFKKSAFFSSLNQNYCPFYDAEEIKKTSISRSFQKVISIKKGR